MNIDLLEADFSNKPALRQMLELYQCEFSDMEQRDLDSPLVGSIHFPVRRNLRLVYRIVNR